MGMQQWVMYVLLSHVNISNKKKLVSIIEMQKCNLFSINEWFCCCQQSFKVPDIFV